MAKEIRKEILGKKYERPTPKSLVAWHSLGPPEPRLGLGGGWGEAGFVFGAEGANANSNAPGFPAGGNS